jgi:hypothetical protein
VSYAKWGNPVSLSTFQGSGTRERLSESVGVAFTCRGKPCIYFCKQQHDCRETSTSASKYSVMALATERGDPWLLGSSLRIVAIGMDGFPVTSPWQ